MGPITGTVPVIDFDEGIPLRFVEGCVTQVGIDELVRFGTGSEPHFCNVE